ncbi:cation:proton antiporter [Mycobacterium sp. THU-M104]
MGEILAGIVLGPAVLGQIPVMDHLVTSATRQGNILTFVYWLGLLLMFVSGAEVQQLFGRGERRTVSWLVIVGTGIPFLLGLSFGPHLIRPSLAGPHGNRLSLVIILAVGVAVTSVPVVSKIFADLNIMDTRFARLILGVAVLEDIVLWLALAIATAVAAKAALRPEEMAVHLAITVTYFVIGLTLAPRVIRRINAARWNVLVQHSPTGYAIAILLAYCAVAGALDVNLVFAAFLAGFAVVHKERRIFDDSMEAISKVSFAFFIPVYFAIVGLKLDLIRGVSLPMIAIFIVGRSSSSAPVRSKWSPSPWPAGSPGSGGWTWSTWRSPPTPVAARGSCWPASPSTPASSARSSTPLSWWRPCSPRSWPALGSTTCCAGAGHC